MADLGPKTEFAVEDIERIMREAGCSEEEIAQETAALRRLMEQQ